MVDNKPRMVGWYNPVQLVPTAIRAAVSSVFGEFADRREAVAAARAVRPDGLDPVFDYSTARTAHDPQGLRVDELWFDFAADTGDGWDSTYAIARLLGVPTLRPAGALRELPRGQFLVLGGDQVYPTASRQLYRDRFIAPFETVLPSARWPAGEPMPHLYAVPGNHDWYDGLQSFLGVFCAREDGVGWPVVKEGRWIGSRKTQQTRSYFALKLPHNWWLCGVDIQLEGYIDQPQINFFQHVAQSWMTAEGPADIILCTGGPDWIYANSGNPDKFRNLDYLESVLTRPGNRLRLVLTGDMHNYSRYVDEIPDHAVHGGQHKRQYITAGGGGAFLHPTHQLPAHNSFTVKFDYRGTEGTSRRDFTLATDDKGEAARYPRAGTSWALSLGDLAFAIWNPWYTATLAGAFALFTWMLDAVARGYGVSLGETLASAFGVDTTTETVSSLLPAVPGWLAWSGAWGQAALAYLAAVFQSPGPVMLVLAALGAYVYLAEGPRWKPRLAIGAGHALAQLAAVVGATIIVARCWPWQGVVDTLGANWEWLAPPLFIVAAAVTAALASATLMGVYLLATLSLGGRHWNEAFSALRIKGHKNFLRLHIARDGTLRVYPIGLARVPSDSGELPRNPPLSPHLIEGPIELPTSRRIAGAPALEQPGDDGGHRPPSGASPV